MNDILNNVLSENLDFYYRHLKQNIKDNNKEIKEENIIKSNKEEKTIDIDYTIDDNISDFDFTEGKKLIQTIELTNDEPLDNKSNDVNGTNNTDYSNLEKTIFNNRNQLELERQKTQEIYEKIKERKDISNKTINYALINIVYEYLYVKFYEFSLVFDDFYDKLEEFKEINVSIKEKPLSVDLETYLKKFRNSSLDLKVNLIAFQLGTYNFNLFIQAITQEDLEKDNKVSFSDKIRNCYLGTNNDILFLKEFKKIVDAEESNEFIFEEIKKDVPIKKEEKFVNNNTEKKKNIFNLKPFSLKK